MLQQIKRILAVALALFLGILSLYGCAQRPHGTVPETPEPTPEDPEQDPGQNPDEPGQNPDEPGQNPDEPGQNPDEPGQNPDELGEIPDEPEPFLPAISTSPNKATTLLLTKAVSGANGITLATLQGLAVKNSETQILVRAHSWSLYLPYMQSAGASVCEQDGDGNNWTLATLLSYYAPDLSGYILSSSDSLSVAISLSGLLNAVVVQPENEQLALDAGLTMIFDTRGLDDLWLRSSEYFARLSRTVAVEQPTSMAHKLVDYAVMAGAYFNFYDGTNADEHIAMFEFLDDGAVILGWNNVLGEYETVKSLSRLNACLIPADHAYNLSTLSSFFGEGEVNGALYASGEADAPNVTSDNVHTVCIVMSDGDNLQWALNDYVRKSFWYSSELRGDFAMTWGLPALLGDLALPMLQYYAGEQSAQDELIMQLSGLGYTFPSNWDENAKWNMAKQLAETMQRRGMKYMNILDDHGLTEQNMYAFTAQSGIEGIFYTDYANYAGYNGEILWSNGIPVVSARYRLWSGIEGCDPESIADSINSAPANVYSQEGYTFIIVHAWSGLDTEGNFVPNGDTMAAVAKLVSLLDGDVEVVGASEFMNRIKDNLAPQ